ncbi:MAG TPA: type II secretion system protein GspL [Steroidobacteraceae bacterium]|nr:type II secretion system protein GspL [Steroidobacteraceae bacterium]
MAEWLLVRFPRSSESAAQWLSADAAGQPLSAPESGPLAAAAPAAAARRLAVVVSGGDVLQTSVQLPPRAGARLQQVLAYALEEQLATDLDQLHIAAADQPLPDGQQAAAVVDSGLMNHWMDVLGGAGLKPEVMCTDTSLLPDNPGHAVLLLESDSMHLRLPGGAPMTLPATDIAATLRLALGEQPASELHLIVYASPLDWQKHGAEVEALRPLLGSLKAQLLASGALPLLAPQINDARRINLLQGEHALKSSWGQHWQRWRIAALVLGAWFLVHVAGQTWSYFQLRGTEQKLDAAIKEFAVSFLPGDDGTGAVRRRAEQRLLDAQKNGGNTLLLGALAHVATGLRRGGGPQLEALNFHDSLLDLKFKAADADSLDRLNRSLNSDGWNAQLTSGTVQSGGYEGRIELKSTRRP